MKPHGLISFFLGAGLTAAQITPFKDYDPITEFPNQIADAVALNLNRARAVAGDDLYPFFAQRCISDIVYPVIDDLAQKPGLVRPRQVFDNLYFLGNTHVTSWLVDLGASGLLLIDALDDAELAEKILVPNIREVGFDPADVNNLIITHEHFDHYGGAAYFQRTFNTTIWASEPAWASFARSNGDVPKADGVLHDGDDLNFNSSQTFHFTLTPGHTPGTISTIWSVADHGEPHVAALYGGGGVPASIENKLLQISSMKRFKSIAENAGVDTLIANHQNQDGSLSKIDLLQYRRCEGGSCQDPHPYVLTRPDAYPRYLEVMIGCVKVNAARNGQDLGAQASKTKLRQRGGYEHEICKA